jgi:hypothetical protein
MEIEKLSLTLFAKAGRYNGNPRNHADSNVVATSLAEIDENWHT